MEQIKLKNIKGKTIKDCRFYEDYITILFEDNTFMHITYDFDEDDGKGFWDDMMITSIMDENGFILPHFATAYFWPGHKCVIPDNKIQGAFEMGIINCNESDLMSIVEENHKRQLEWRRRSMMELASEFGIELTEEQKEQINKMIL